ncbi:MAG: hypothetical protein JWQ52_287, partial [Phenylobacterium sp.]|nr:hypothetical protein [Phenylobacterium sp.]
PGQGDRRGSDRRDPNRSGDRPGWTGDPRRGDQGQGYQGRSFQGRGNDRGDRSGWRQGGDHGQPRWDRRSYPSVYRSPQRYRGGFYQAPYGFYARSWGYGDILPRGWYGDQYRLTDWWNYGLPEPPPGYAWVRVGADVLLIDEYSGQVVQVVRNLFW